MSQLVIQLCRLFIRSPPPHSKLLKKQPTNCSQRIISSRSVLHSLFRLFIRSPPHSKLLKKKQTKQTVHNGSSPAGAFCILFSRHLASGDVTSFQTSPSRAADETDNPLFCTLAFSRFTTKEEKRSQLPGEAANDQSKVRMQRLQS